MTLPVEVVKARATPSGDYSPSAVTLYGIVLASLDAWIGKAFQSTSKPTKVSIIPQPTYIPANVGKKVPHVKYSPALIYAFAYQAHCYHLPEPVIVIVDRDEEKPAIGFDFDKTGYSMWDVEKLDRTLQLEPTSDTIEEIILKRALMGTKQPISYAAHAQLSHRGGKLSD
jgi:hypothetical protein